MKTLKVKKPAVGFYLLAAALAVIIAAFIVSVDTFRVFHYDLDKWVVALNVIILWTLVCILANSFFLGDKFLPSVFFYGIALFCTVIALFKLLIPCLSPIGIYFTVHNMGDVEANALGVPRCIAGVALYVVAIVLLTTSAFMRVSKGGDGND